MSEDGNRMPSATVSGRMSRELREELGRTATPPTPRNPDPRAEPQEAPLVGEAVNDRPASEAIVSSPTQQRPIALGGRGATLTPTETLDAFEAAMAAGKDELAQRLAPDALQAICNRLRELSELGENQAGFVMNVGAFMRELEEVMASTPGL